MQHTVYVKKRSALIEKNRVTLMSWSCDSHLIGCIQCCVHEIAEGISGRGVEMICGFFVCLGFFFSKIHKCRYHEIKSENHETTKEKGIYSVQNVILPLPLGKTRLFKKMDRWMRSQFLLYSDYANA